MMYIYYKNLLSCQEQLLYDDLLKGIVKQISPIYSKVCDNDQINLNRVIHALRYDRPELFFVDWNNFEFWYEPSTRRFKIIPAYYYTEEQTVRFLARIREIAQGIIDSAPQNSLYEKTLYLHDYLAKKCRYLLYEKNTNDCFNLVGSLIQNVCVCAGFAHAYKYLCDMADIPCIIVVGNVKEVVGPAGRHAWNLICINGKQSYVDVTFDNKETDQFCSRAYFLMSEERMLYEHTPDPEYKIPGPAVEQSPLPIVSSIEELKSFLRRDQNRGRYTEYLLSTPCDINGLIDDFERSITSQDHSYYNRIEHYSYSENNPRFIGIFWRQ